MVGHAEEGMVAGCCSVCGFADARGLLAVALEGGDSTVLCGTHELMYRRGATSARTVSDLRESFGDRRNMDRRAVPAGDFDELALNLTAAFTTERRVNDRRGV
ncbi:hypothetical protein AKJ09_05315 [Labilithrix luteola]|uniref:Uncharacterized protein n=2 Tax=Labilithrix luteola TaxID=1391654 RepID=A0A0K1PZ23_9BACT|nr:hypothetical protein AKJ09_05315 [Labilithrix luteola]